jgi:hypothetical protein
MQDAPNVCMICASGVFSPESGAPNESRSIDQHVFLTADAPARLNPIADGQGTARSTSVATCREMGDN